MNRRTRNNLAGVIFGENLDRDHENAAYDLAVASVKRRWGSAIEQGDPVFQSELETDEKNQYRQWLARNPSQGAD
jgi:hypothetical protein